MLLLYKVLFCLCDLIYNFAYHNVQDYGNLNPSHTKEAVAWLW